MRNFILPNHWASALGSGLLLFAVVAKAASPPIRIAPGYVYKLRCEGRLILSAIGNESLFRLEALPREVGCGALLKATAPSGVTNLILETSTGTVKRLIEIAPGRADPAASLEIWVRAEEDTP